MTELVDTENTLEPLAYSADGKRNSFILACTPTGQSMNYAACIWRQGVLAKPNVNTPPDWNVCKQACNEGRCTALIMRREEELAGKSIYFRCRTVLAAVSSAAREWIMPKGTATSVPHSSCRSSGTYTPPAPAPAPRAKTMFDAMGSMGTLADAVTEAAKTPTAPPPTEPKLPEVMRPRIVATIPGESPLQMARRLHAERLAAA